MRVQFLLVAAACALCLLALPQPSAPAEPQEAAMQIDFDALHAQAKGALEALRQTQQRQVASASSTEF
ncbi:MAG TPA: hypothetical protein VIV34_13630 [Pseudolabrys sp.]